MFDELYSDIFCRPTVKASYIAYLFRLMSIIQGQLSEIESERVRRYTLTRYFLLYCLRQGLQQNPIWERLHANPAYLTEDSNRWEKFKAAVGEILVGMISDLNGEIHEQGETFDHKDVFKSPIKSRALAKAIVDVYKKELRRKKVEPVEL